MVTLPTFHCSPQSSPFTPKLPTIYHPIISPLLSLYSPSFPSATSPPDQTTSFPHPMDIYTMSSSGHQDYSTVDELLDFSNDDDNNDTFSPSNDVILHQHHNNMTSSSSNNTFNYNYNSNENNNYDFATAYNHSTNFTDELCVPSDDVAELEWLSNFVHDSFSNFPANNMAGTINYRPENTSFHSRSRTKRTRAPTHNHHNGTTTTAWTSSTTAVKIEAYSSPTSSSSDNTTEGGIVRRCTHCSSEKTPQWRTGPLGPKTLCNACGVRYKSGRLVPEYRPAASPTFVLTQHSNSHRKVMELRRQKEMMIGQPQQSTASEYQLYGNGHQSYHHHNNYEVC